MVSCFFLKASQALLKVGLHSIFMKLALCEIGFCLMDPCMGAPPDTPASPPRHSGWRRTGSEKQGKKKKKGAKIVITTIQFYKRPYRKSALYEALSLWLCLLRLISGRSS